jgi:4'-phosphopantetheinyl transferase
MIHGSSAAWHRPDGWPTCDRRDVHVWRAQLTTIAGFDHFQGFLSADERSRAARFHFRADMERFAVVRGLLRAILGRYTGVDPAAFVFSYSARGKPAIADPADARPLTFNVSHSADVCLIAVGRERSIGVDVERLRDIEALEISRHFFSPDEIEVLETVSGAERQRAFFSCWTRRESVLKACGEGLAALDRVEQRVVDGCRRATVNDPDGPRSEWAVVDLDPGVGCVGALAASGHEWTLSCWDAGVT